MDPRIAWAKTELERRLHEPVTVAALARQTNLSPSRFAHLFRRELGIAPLQFVRRARLARARVLVERTFLTVKEVMAVVGFTDPSHFTRDFRRAYGVTPSQLRATGWTGCQRHDPAGASPDGSERRSSFGRAAAAASDGPPSPRRPSRPKVR